LKLDEVIKKMHDAYAFDEKNPAPKWAKSRKYCFTGEVLIIEDVCEHGVGHPNPAWLETLPEEQGKAFRVHECDGCCKGEEP